MHAEPHHLRWILEAPSEVEEPLTAWLMEQGATAVYQEADPPRHRYAYFPPGVTPPDPAGLSAFQAQLVRAESFEDADWLAKSREGFGCLEVGRSFFIRPLWDTRPASEGRLPVVVNPGLAFGTGGHETTRLCMALLEDLAAESRLEDPVLDIGSGTGILALAAHLLGAREVTAFDLDPDCGPAMEELVELNRAVLQDPNPFHAFVGTLDDPRADGPFRLLLANILLETIQELLPRMADICAPGGLLIASGILAERVDEALVSLVLEGFQPLRVTQEGAWVAILAQRHPA